MEKFKYIKYENNITLYNAHEIVGDNLKYSMIVVRKPINYSTNQFVWIEFHYGFTLHYQDLFEEGYQRFKREEKLKRILNG